MSHRLELADELQRWSDRATRRWRPGQVLAEAASELRAADAAIARFESGILCDSDGCLAWATVWLMFAHQPGHVHNCPGHERINVEHSAVVAMGLVDDGHPCEGPIYTAKPTPKES